MITLIFRALCQSYTVSGRAAKVQTLVGLSCRPLLYTSTTLDLMLDLPQLMMFIVAWLCVEVLRKRAQSPLAKQQIDLFKCDPLGFLSRELALPYSTPGLMIHTLNM